jgi:hypothetical protein
MVWNDGDGPDDVEGGAGVDTMEVNGAPDQSDEFVVEPTNCPTPPSCSVQLRAPAGLDIATSERLLVNGQRTHSDRRVAGGALRACWGMTAGPRISRAARTASPVISRTARAGRSARLVPMAAATEPRRARTSTSQMSPPATRAAPLRAFA